ncbi:MAG: right-handed parallel beta-helix repeat-containing protein [Verrucomicrobia bacterium]|nr:right-handed parallel beta-helix repeat-containing protein [Verrucomicrobiota bacterium]
MKFRKIHFGMALALMLLSTAVEAGQTYHVDVNNLGGSSSDSNPGSVDKPWKTAMKAFTTAGPGDTVIFHRGVYRLARTVLTTDLKLDPSRTGPVVFKAPKGEEAVISVMKPIPASAWKLIATTKTGQPIYAATSGEDGRVVNLTQDGMPLARPFPVDPHHPHADSTPEVITQPGEWASSLKDHQVMVCPTDGKPPGDRIEVCDVRPGDGGANLFDLQRDSQDRCRNLHLIFDHLTLEGGNFGFTIRTGFVEFHHCVLRKCFSDMVNMLSGRILVDDCDFSAFGESAIDMTTTGNVPMPPNTPPMSIRNSRFHHNAEVRTAKPRVKGYNAIMLKGGCMDVLVENNDFHHLRVTESTLTLGGSTAGGPLREGCRITARNNFFHDITGNSIAVFAASEDCSFVNNLLRDNHVDDLITLIRSGSGAKNGSLRPVVQNNIFYRNRVKHDVLSLSPMGAAEGLIFDHNLIHDSGDRCCVDDVAITLKEMPSRGFQMHGVNQMPLFRDPAKNDFHPLAESPTVDRGADLHALIPTDADGLARPQGKAFDIGPFEMR